MAAPSKLGQPDHTATATIDKEGGRQVRQDVDVAGPPSGLEAEHKWAEHKWAEHKWAEHVPARLPRWCRP